MYVMERRSYSVKVWFFPRSHVPPELDDIDHPPAIDAMAIENWGTPYAQYDLSPEVCDGTNPKLRNLHMVLEIDQCGPFAGNGKAGASMGPSNKWNPNSKGSPLRTDCSILTQKQTCEDFVNDLKGNPSDENEVWFSEAYWSIRSLRAYSLTMPPMPPTPPPGSPPGPSPMLPPPLSPWPTDSHKGGCNGTWVDVHTPHSACHTTSYRNGREFTLAFSDEFEARDRDLNAPLALRGLSLAPSSRAH